jgi:D-glycero-D-manno-heptose 1,7-bisphosphate phosphatase
MQKAIFLDRDGTINVDHGYVYKSDELEFIEGVENSLKKLQDAGYLLIIITNQSGIGRGYFSELDTCKYH